MKRGRSHLTRNLWILVWLAVGLIQAWDVFRDKGRPPPVQPDGSFTQLIRPRLVSDSGNDGDSFKVAHDGGAHVLRLYFVDCPEKRQYSLVQNRLKDQSGYFGGLSIPQTVSVGVEARDFTEKLLTQQRFTVKTRWETVYDSQRSYALVFFDDGEELSEKLVKAGLCRIHTKGTRMPDGRAEFDFERHLRDLEREAKAARRGAWGKPKRASSKSKP